VKESLNCKRHNVNESFATALALKRIQSLSSFRIAPASGGREQNPRLGTILRHSPALPEKFSQIDFRTGISLFHRYPEQADCFRQLCCSAGRTEDL
jgi:hypothetical protein